LILEPNTMLRKRNGNFPRRIATENYLTVESKKFQQQCKN
jgi:hypothetical protein